MSEGDLIPGNNAGSGRASDMSDLPSVRAYLNRIGATVRSMCRAVVQERDGNYFRDVATVRLNPKDGTVTVRVPDWGDVSPYEPTDAERRDIAHEAIRAKWHEHLPVKVARNLPQEVQDADPDDVFEFRNEDGNIVMVQLRVNSDRGKSYLPYTYWSDGQWRMIEPDGPLPLWGIEQLQTFDTVFVHEGAKAARAVRRMVEAQTPEEKAKLAAHPWGQSLTHAAHIGWIGGAFAAGRTDWAILKRLGVKRVVIMADNDPPGHAAVPRISKLLSPYDIIVDVVRVDSRFPVGFDLADPFPASMFSTGADGVARYSGPSFADALQPATWATMMKAAPVPVGRGRPASPVPVLREQFSRRWIMVAGEGKPLFVSLHDPSRLYTEEGFNTLARPFSDEARTSVPFKQQAYASHVSVIVYEPGDKQGIIIVEGIRSVNTWVMPNIARVAGDPQPWLDFMVYLFPDPGDRHEVMRWCATLIACPRVRMKYGLLLASAMQGVGKTTLCEILRILVGPQNCSAPSVKDVVESGFNSWLVRKRLVFVNEIYEGSSWKASQRLKSYISDPTIEANEKMIRGYSIKNWAHFILCSNADVPVRLDQEDRRFLVPQVTEIKRAKAEWEAFHLWLAGGGYGIIAAWADAFVAEHGHVRDGDEAPFTTRKEHLIEDSLANEEHWVADLAMALVDHAAATGGQAVLVVDDVVEWLAGRSQTRFKAATVRRWLAKAGLHISARLKVDRKMTYVAGVAPVTGKGWPDLQVYRQRPESLAQM